MPENFDQAVETGENSEMIRCVSIIGFQGHGKTELCNWLVAKAGVEKIPEVQSSAKSHTPRGSLSRERNDSLLSAATISLARKLRVEQEKKRLSRVSLSAGRRISSGSSQASDSLEADLLKLGGEISHTKVHTLLHLFMPNDAKTVPYSIEGLRQATLKKDAKKSRVFNQRHTQALTDVSGLPLFLREAMDRVTAARGTTEDENGSRGSSGSEHDEDDNVSALPMTGKRHHCPHAKINDVVDRASTTTPTSGLHGGPLSMSREKKASVLDVPETRAPHRSSMMRSSSFVVSESDASEAPMAVQRRPRRSSTVGTFSTQALSGAKKVNKAEDKKEDKRQRLKSSKSARFTAATPLLVYVFDTPGHADLAADVAASLRLSDGALVVVDAEQGFSSHLEVLVRQALAERVRPTLFVGGLDRCILEQKMSPEEIHKRMRSIVDSMNNAIDSYKDELLGDVRICPERGDAVFGSTTQGWAFNIHVFADLYYTKFGLDREKLAARLWAEDDPGDDLLSEQSDTRNSRAENRGSFAGGRRSLLRQAAEEAVTGKEASGNQHKRAPGTEKFLACDMGAPVKASSQPQPRARSLLCRLILSPLCHLVDALMSFDTARQQELLSGLGLELTESEKFLRAEELVQCVLSRWLGAAENVLEMVRLRLPSPKEAQRYRVENLYGGPVDDAAATAVRDCDPEGPMMTFVSRMLPTPEGGLFALGRVFSGSIVSGRPVWVRSLGRSKRDGVRIDSSQMLHSIESVAMPLGTAGAEPMTRATCGNVVAIFGVDQFILKAGTLTDLEDATDIADLQFSTVRPVVRVAVKPVMEEALPKLTKALRRLSKVDPLVECAVEEWGEHVLLASGKHHIDECLKALKADFSPDQFVTASPVGSSRERAHDSYHVVYRETVREAGQLCTATTPNELCDLSATAEPLDESLSKDMEAGMLQPRRLADEELLHTFVEHYNWSRADAVRIWCYGPGEAGANFVVDGTENDINSSREPHHLEVQGAVTAACQWATREGGLCEEAMRGVRFTLRNIGLHADHLQRGTGQIIGAARRCFLAAELSAAPCLEQPFLTCEVVCDDGAILHSARELITQRHGVVMDEKPIGYGGSTRLAFQISVVDSFGLHEELADTGTGIVQAAFSHWERVPGDPASPGHHQDIILALRRWRQLKTVVPLAEEFLGHKAMITPADIFVDELTDLTVSLGRVPAKDGLDADEFNPSSRVG